MSQFPKAFTSFKSNISNLKLPTKFTFPFQYEPNELCIIAAKETQNLLESLKNLNHNFGIDHSKKGLVIGKMFGVLVVKTKNGEIGYLKAFSGKLANENHHEGFVPPIFDMLSQESYFLKEEQILNDINKEIERIEQNNSFKDLIVKFNDFEKESNETILFKKNQIKEYKQARKNLRLKNEKLLNETDYEIFNADLIKQSLRDKFELKNLIEKIEFKKKELITKLNHFEFRLNELKNLRKEKSNSLQNYLFNQYKFLNINKEVKNLLDIFKDTTIGRPPAAAGDCAAPKLLQYAFLNDLTPICMAEFWWGASPKSEIRKHLQFYPSCTGKCEPILGHMLKNIPMDENPLLINPADNIDFDIVYQDDDVVLVNKPEEMLSVPGINISDSVFTRIKKMFPDADGPIIVHRLDMATSGLLLLALNKKAHKFLQSQFINHTIEKRYEALLDGNITIDEGFIDLPLRVDLDDRPRQMVCYEFGKYARTKFKVIERSKNSTRIYFWPITGRTHQLRVHASHILGLNCAIIGDDLYGKKNKRLCLHAGFLKFIHPTTKSILTFEIPPNF